MDSVQRSQFVSCSSSELDEFPRQVLQRTLEQAIDALACIDADRLESLTHGLEESVVSVSLAEAQRAASSHRVLALLLKETDGHLRMLSRIPDEARGGIRETNPVNAAQSETEARKKWQR